LYVPSCTVGFLGGRGFFIVEFDEEQSFAINSREKRMENFKKFFIVQVWVEFLTLV